MMMSFRNTGATEGLPGPLLTCSEMYVYDRYTGRNDKCAREGRRGSYLCLILIKKKERQEGRNEDKAYR
jgi:hypothetical protein